MIEIDSATTARAIRKLSVPALLFGLAFTLDMATGQRHSMVLGSAAIVGSIVAVFTAIRASLLALGAYAGVWIGFNLLRAVSDDAGVSLVDKSWLAKTESEIFTGTLPSALLQESIFSTGWRDWVFTLVHVSFFVTPYVTALLIWAKQRRQFRTYLVETATTLVISLVGFLLMPTVPPWLADPGNVRRVVHEVTYSSGTTSSRSFWFEPNELAALPSVHVAAAVLVAFAWRSFGRGGGVVGGVYVVLMSISVVYLGEHHVLDVLTGWAVALAGWILAPKLISRFPGTELRQ